MTRIAGIGFTFILLSGCTDGRAESRQHTESLAESTARRASITDSARVTTRRLLTGFPGGLAGAMDPMPDGKRVALMNDETGDLAIRDIATGKDQFLTHNSKPWEPGFMVNTPRVSSDGKRIAYVWQPDGWVWAIDLRVVNVDGSAERTILKSTQLYIQPMDWSPDGRTILAWRSTDDGMVQIVLVPADGAGPIRVLRTLDWQEPRGMNFSPDGRFIVFDAAPTQKSNKHDVYVLAADGSRETHVVNNPANDYVLGWAPDGRHILFASDRSGVPAAWLLAVDKGKPRGEPQLIKSELWRMLPIGFTPSGAYFYGVETSGRNLLVATIDSVTGKVVGTPSRITQAEPTSLDWSRDGRFIAYAMVRNNAAPPVIAIHSLQTGEIRELALPARVQYVVGMRWLSDGKAILLRGSERGHAGVFRLDVETGAIAEILGHGAASLDAMPNDNAMVYLDEAQTAIVVRRLSDGAERVVYKVEKGSFFPQALAVTPDGTQLAFFRKIGGSSELMTVSLQGGEPRRIAILDTLASGPTNLRWAKDGRSLLFTSLKGERRPPPGEVSTIGVWRVAAAGGIPEPIGLKGTLLKGIALSPDGRRVAYASGFGRSELWVMEHFQPQ